MKILLISLSLIVMYGLAGADDVKTERAGERLCNEMVDLFIDSGGDLGWPQEACK
mgnify:FL=1